VRRELVADRLTRYCARIERARDAGDDHRTGRHFALPDVPLCFFISLLGPRCGSPFLGRVLQLGNVVSLARGDFQGCVQLITR